MRAVKRALPMVLAGLFVLFLMPQGALAATLSAGTPEELTAALGSAASGDTIQLTANIDYNTGISILGKAITFDLNGYTLNVSSSTGDALDVGIGGTVSVTGSGALNATSSAADSYGVNAQDGGQATVTNASSTGTGGVGAHAIGSVSSVHVTGNAASTDNIGALARGGGTVIVDGNAEGVTGADGVGNNTLVEVGGDVTGNKGVACALGAVVNVGGNVIASGNCPDPRAIAIAYGGTVTVDGDVTASGEDTVGVMIFDGGTATVDGRITAPIYIELQENVFTAADGTVGTSPYESYLIYTSGGNTVRAKHHPVITPASAAFDKHAPADAQTAVTWGIASSVTDVKTGGVSIGAGNYSVSGDTLAIKKEYLAAQALGSLTLTVEFDTGKPTALTITVSDSTPITGLPDSQTLYMGGRVTWTPSPAGGTWAFDTAYLSSSSSGGAVTFTALKAGTTTATYSVNGQSHSVAITVLSSQLPQTGQDATLAWVLGALAAICAVVAAVTARAAIKSRL